MRRAPLLVVALLAGAPLAAGADAPQPVAPTQTPGVLVVALNMPSQGFQIGAVAGARVVLARGLEVDLARAIASRLGIGRVRFVQVSSFPALLTPGPKAWDMALAEITITPARGRSVDFSLPYLSADQGVLLAKGVAVPRGLAALAGLRVCSLRGTTSAALVARRVRPASPPILEATSTALGQDLQTGRCQAGVEDAPILAALKARVPLRFGPFAGVIRTGERYGIAFPKGSELVDPVNDALGSLSSSGALARFERRWLTTNLAALPALR